MSVRSLALLAASLWLLLPLDASARTFTVGRDASTLAGTLALTEDGDVVVLPDGTFAGGVRIEKSITLRGSGTVDGGGTGTVLRVVAPNVVIESVTVIGSGSDLNTRDSGIYTEPTATGVTIRNTTVRDCAFGIWLHETDRGVVEGNQIFGRRGVRSADRGNGIHLFDSDHLVVRGNRVQDSRDGIYVSATDDSEIDGNHVSGQRYGIHYMYSYRNTLRNNTANDNIGGLALMQSRDLFVEDNTASGNERVGILFRDAQGCKIRRNRLEGNGQGMFFFSSTDNEIADNVIVGNQIGAKIWAGSLRNDVHGNSFVANAQQVFYVSASDLVWGEDGGGNYFSDYVGWDQDGDGIGDRPHRLDSFTANLIHRYPSAVLLVRSPVMELLTHLEARMPVLRVPTVVDLSPLMGRS